MLQGGPLAVSNGEGLIDTRRFKISHDTPWDVIARTCLREERVGRAITTSARQLLRCSGRRGLTTLRQVSRLDAIHQVGQLAVSTGADLVDNRRFKINHHTPRDVFARTCLGEERIRLDAVLQAEQLYGALEGQSLAAQGTLGGHPKPPKPILPPSAGLESSRARPWVAMRASKASPLPNRSR